MKLHVVCCRMMVACLSIGSALVGNAQSWALPGGGSWGVGANWEGGAVPDGTAPVAFTTPHASLATVELDGDRLQTVGMTFGGGEWRIEPGAPAGSALTLSNGVTVTTLDGVATLAAPGIVATGKVTFDGGGEFRIDATRLFSTMAINSGDVRVTQNGLVSTYSDTDIFVDGTGSLFLDGGTINTKILRLGNDVYSTNTLFRMTSGTVNCGGSGDAVLLIGYNTINNRLDGKAAVEILGGTFSATGSVSNAGVFVGARVHGSLLVGGTDTPAELNCGRLWFGWRDGNNQPATTNLLTIATNGTVTASVSIYTPLSAPTGTIRLEQGGVLRTPTVLSAYDGAINVVFDGGRFERTGTSDTLFSGSNVRVVVDADSVLDIGATDTASLVPVSGIGTLAKFGTGTLSLAGSHAGFSGAWAVEEGALALLDGAVFSETAEILLADGTGLDASGVQVLAAEVVVANNAVVAVHPDGTTFRALTLLGDGVVAIEGDGLVNILALDVPAGTDAEISCAGQVVIGALTGGGTLTVSGGGSFGVIDDVGIGVSVSAAPDGTDLNMGVNVIESLYFDADATVETFGKTLTVQTLTLAGGTFQVTGGGELVVQNLLVTGNASVITYGAGTAITNIASLVIEPDAAFTLDAQEPAYIGTAQGGGTFRLTSGIATIADLHSGISFDIEDGEVVATSAPVSATAPAFSSGEPAFWVDASASASLSTVSGKLVWSDRRGGAFPMKATAMDVAPSIAAEPSLGSQDVIRFASPHNNGSHKGMQWDQRLTNIRTVFWVVGAQEGGGQLLGDASLIEFLRGEYPPKHPGASNQLDWPKGIHYAPLISQQYADANRCIRDMMRLGGKVIDPRQTGYPHPGFHVVSVRTENTVSASGFAAERVGQNADRSGCQRLAECIVFTNALTDAEIEATEAYLQRKWFGVDASAPAVRLGGANARFTAQGGAMRVDELYVAANGPDPVNAVSGVTRVEQLTTARDLTLLYDAATQNVPLNAQSLRVEDDAEITVNALPSQSVWIGQITGQGSVTVADGVAVNVGSALTLPDENLKLEVPASVPAVMQSWLGQGSLEVAGASAVDLKFADISGTARLAVTGGADIPLTMTLIRATGAWTLEGTVDPFIDGVFLYGNGGQTWTLDIGGKELRIQSFWGQNTFRWNGPDRIRIMGSLRASDGNDPILPVEAFNPVIPTIIIAGGSRGLVLTGAAELSVNNLIVEGEPNMTCRLTFDPGVSMTVPKFECRPVNNASFYLPTEGTLTIDQLQMRAECAIFFPVNQITTVRTLAISPTDGRAIVRDGILRITETINTCKKFTVIGEGIIFPDGTMLAPSMFDVRTPSRFDLGVGSTFTLAIADQVFEHDVTFTNGTVAVNEDAAFDGMLRLDGTALSVAAGETLTAAALGGDGTITLAAGSVLNVRDQVGFNGTITSGGGSLYVSSDRTNSIPSGPVMEPAFWVDASQGGSFVTNSPNQLVWLDKRTARDGTPGLMYATSSNMPSILHNEMNGLPIVDFGPLGSGGATGERGMAWNQRLTNVRAVHWVIGAQNGGGQMLGDHNGAHIDYFRYSDAPSTTDPYSLGYGDYRTPLWSGTRFYDRSNEHISNVVNGVTYMDGQAMARPGHTDGFPSPDYHLLSLRTAGSTCAGAFASERIGGGYAGRSGAQRLGEVLIYNGTVLTEKQNRDNDAYLTWKWFGQRFEDYRLPDEGLLVLRGSGDVFGANVLAREIAPAAAGLSMDGNLYLDAYPAAADVGAVIRLDTLPATGTAAVSVSGDVYLPSRVTIVLGEVQTGTFFVMAADGTIHGSPEWLLDTSAVPSAAAYQISVTMQGSTVLLKISGKGTTLLLQ